MWQPTKGSGAGGQHRNKVATGMRCTHKDSGAVGLATDSKSQIQNKRSSFKRMAATDKFKAWHRVESARMMGMSTVETSMHDENLKVEVRRGGKWVTE